MHVGLRSIAVTIASLAATATAVARDDAVPPGLEFVRLARAAFHTGERPAFIVYTIDRRDTVEGVPDFANTYTERIWCRTSDGSALARRVGRSGRATGDLEHLVVRFDDRVDPGPPTADLFEPARPRNRRGDPLAEPAPQPTVSALTEIGRVVTHYEADYRVGRVQRDATLVHLTLEPLRDPERNRVREVWLDAATHAVTRLQLDDHLYTPAAAIPERFDVRFAQRDGIPIVTSIHGETDQSGSARAAAPFHTVDYRFRDVEFAAALPAWYFDGRSYGTHRNEAPES